ncbi:MULTISPECIES: alpha,alpha-trehalose-phosphate synthase (UDP-forming) [Pseudomonas]|uniref:Trehalose-6-phosphate synthase n=1 Tax=Pseudomonas nitroreducens TaxID=46680 RepID=A0A246F3E5_PSENT|nr:MULTISPECIES: alpha,alpha-trehalose-phosphate synthase (UDP-forming) [Pseudomonas]MCG8908084.1 alpha,alpha-trehalose-phosphate synthase (UDP-forming) [Pseudomonas sp. DP-17]MDU4253149.1 alpha,alpha-trehalose-phosphate synthase (UDP-forming) [Pseudomonas sp.]OWP47520.1 alpha,alpha-trehalose-phosphate synthase (UDP-forming) [Pseudomonas nitroreducens]
MPRLVVISNRVAIPDENGPAPGGLAVAVEAAMRNRQGIWFGWSGEKAEEPGPPSMVQRDNLQYILTDLHPQDFDEYYNGFANRVLWPILHYRVDLAEFNEAEFGGYQRVNEFFAERLSPLLEEDDVLWVHDYHLIPLASALRQRGHANRIGFFLHIPMPPADLITALPHHDELFRALTQYNLIGFQTENDASNFARYLTRVVGAATPDGRRYHLEDQHFRVGVFPVGVDAAGFRRLAEEASQSQAAQDLRDSLGERALMVGVDRLDYSKGIVNRLDGYERFLERNPDWHNRVTCLQISPGSRQDIPEYADIDAAVSARVGHVNGRFGAVSWVPLRYVARNHQRSDIAMVLRHARIGLVTPLRDGMNLVAKEFVAAQDPDDPGVLILSQFAGAAAELGGALIINPHDRDALADAMLQALRMPLKERQARHRDMYAVLEANDIRFWGPSFIDALTRPGRALNWLSNHYLGH